MIIMFPKREVVEEIREKYPVGSKVRLLRFYDIYTNIPIGTIGTVTNVDDIGTIHVNWETGHKLGVAYLVDECELVN